MIGLTDKTLKPHNMIQEMMEAKISEMKAACDAECRAILISKGIAKADFTPYQWRRLSKLLESRESGVVYYLGDYQEIRVYQVQYFEPEDAGWGFDRNPTDPFVVQLGSYQVTPLNQ